MADGLRHSPIAEVYETCVEQDAGSLQHHVTFVAKIQPLTCRPNYSIQTETFSVPRRPYCMAQLDR